MSNISDDIATSSLIGMILGIPIFVGIAILAIPFIIISGIIGVPTQVLIKSLLIFAVALILVWLFSRHQIIENGIVGLIVGSLVHTYFQWHSVVCILIGVAIVGLLFLFSNIKIGFWIKTILFSVVVTFMVFVVLYSDAGLFPLPDMIWKIAFIIIFFLENIFIRCAVAYDNGVLGEEHGDYKKEEYHYDVRQAGAAMAQIGNNECQDNNSTISEMNNLVRKMNAEILEEREKEISTRDAGISEIQEEAETSEYLMDRVYLFSQKKSFWDGNPINNMEEKVYSVLKSFIDTEYLILPHVSFREIFWWGDWKSEPKLTDRVTKMHFDFGIYNKELQPIFFLEIQGKEHKENPKVMERDKFKAEIMRRCGMKLITMDCSEPMSDSEIREKVVMCIKKEVPARKAYAVYCPNCKSRGKNSLMILRRNKTDGTFFYGCSTYEENKQDKCPTLNLDEVPPLYWGMPLFKEKDK